MRWRSTFPGPACTDWFCVCFAYPPQINGAKYRPLSRGWLGNQNSAEKSRPGEGAARRAALRTPAAPQRLPRTDGGTAAEAAAGTDPPGGGTAPAPRQALTAWFVPIPLLCPQPSQGQEARSPLALSPRPGIPHSTRPRPEVRVRACPWGSCSPASPAALPAPGSEPWRRRRGRLGGSRVSSGGSRAQSWAHLHALSHTAPPSSSCCWPFPRASSACAPAVGKGLSQARALQAPVTDAKAAADPSSLLLFLLLLRAVPATRWQTWGGRRRGRRRGRSGSGGPASAMSGTCPPAAMGAARAPHAARAPGEAPRAAPELAEGRGARRSLSSWQELQKPRPKMPVVLLLQFLSGSRVGQRWSLSHAEVLHTCK